MFYCTQDWYKIWKKTGLRFQKWHEEFRKFSPEHLGKSKNWDFDGILLSKVENLWAQSLQGSLFHENEEWYKIWKGIDLLVQNWHEEFDKFWVRALRNLKNLHFNGLLLNKIYVWAKKSIGEFCLMALKLMQNLKETSLCFLKIFVYLLKNSNFVL